MVEPLDVTVTGADVVPSAAPATKVVGPHGVRVSVELVASRTRMVAVDVVAYRENFLRRVPFPHLYHVGDALRGIDRARELADEDALVVPGHDPAISPELVTRLD